ncbi:Na+/H+ antiporter subunit E [Bacillus horti]|uniref:Multicomponent Na+:H+ antiporter subunit E n=1 Tax=Caldalkalibacillus horti TaxID=77523 RepID=A0ABT9VT29_9BACI|nr:Na+/H+ antiporter subunit E [Bacillus horti]MDQ0164142.1 multicomponent Na+:H+ antiporter subunit E [Bacillus horti]
MSFQIILNLILAFVWMFLTNNWSYQGFTIGYLIGLVCIYFLRRFIPYSFYVRKLYFIIRILLLFFTELVVSSYDVLKHVVSPKLNIQPGIFTLHTELDTEWEITILSLLIALTPGTVTLEISPQRNILYIHAMDVPKAEVTVTLIKEKFERKIMEVSRK